MGYFLIFNAINKRKHCRNGGERNIIGFYCIPLGRNSEWQDVGQLGHKERIAALMSVYTLVSVLDMDMLRAIAHGYKLNMIVEAAGSIGETCECRHFGQLLI